jgi:hypothetical protein
MPLNFVCDFAQSPGRVAQHKLRIVTTGSLRMLFQTPRFGVVFF